MTTHANTGQPAAPTAGAGGRGVGDLRPLLARALDQAGTLVTTTDPARGTLPTPCDAWDVATLVGHLQAVVRRIGAVLDGRTPMSVPVVLASADWVGDWGRGRAATDAVLADDANLDRVVTVPWGTVTGREAIAMYVGELATHAWDLAVATGRTDGLDESLAQAALPGARAKIPAQGRDGIPFGPVVEVGDDATAYERLVAWEGRDPRWTP